MYISWFRRPKGVEMPRGPLKNLILWQNTQLKKKIGLRTLQFAPISFDVHFQEIFGALTTGGKYSSSLLSSLSYPK